MTIWAAIIDFIAALLGFEKKNEPDKTQSQEQTILKENCANA
jgi:hypothetical protein